MYVKLYEISFWKKSKLNQGFLETSKKPWELVSCSVWKAAEVRLISLALQTKTNSIWESNRRIFLFSKMQPTGSLVWTEIPSILIRYLTNPPSQCYLLRIYISQNQTHLIDCQNFALKISFAMSTRVCKSTVIEKRQHQLGRMADFPLLVTFSVFDL